MSTQVMPHAVKTATPPSPQAAHDLASGRDTLRAEAEALGKLAEALDSRFTQAIDLILARPGRVIVSGMGKSGHVAKKITATLASTGTPAYFVHPAEASHGDLGMITENDSVILLSKTGESPELRDLINYCKRFSVPLIAVTMKPESALGRQADVILQLPEAQEACPNQQAPTTSATMTMALGDALAIALMKRRGFTATDFRQYHPGGKLGGQLITVATVMQKGDALPLLREDATVSAAQKIMSANKTTSARSFGCAIVVNARGELAGFVSDGDLRRHLSPDLLQQRVSQIMTAQPRTVAVDELASAALAVMDQLEITQLVVVDGKVPVGLVLMHDILRAGVA